MNSPAHKESQQERVKRRKALRRKRRAAGLCGRCGKGKATGKNNMGSCKDCLARNAEKNRRRRERQEAEAIRRATNPTRRERMEDAELAAADAYVEAWKWAARSGESQEVGAGCAVAADQAWEDEMRRQKAAMRGDPEASAEVAAAETARRAGQTVAAVHTGATSERTRRHRGGAVSGAVVPGAKHATLAAAMPRRLQ